MATVTKEIKYSYLGKELIIKLFVLFILVIVLLISMNQSNENINDIDWGYTRLVVYIIVFFNLYNWTVWKLAGGWKE